MSPLRVSDSEKELAPLAFATDTPRPARAPNSADSQLIRWSAPEGASNTGDHQCRT
nr:MAG TPA: hypothetical protein [Caudoviricetes sp.]